MANVPMHPGGAPGPTTRGGSKAGAIVALVLGILLALLGVGGIIGGVASAAVLNQQDGDGYLTAPMRSFSTTSYALVSPPAEISVAEVPFDVGRIRFTAESTEPGGEVFIGIGPKTEVRKYLNGVHTSEITEVRISPFRVQYRDTTGPVVPSAPDKQDFWASSASGPGTQQITMELLTGDWELVIMNSDASPGVSANLQAAFNSTLLGQLPRGLWISGVIALLIGAGLITLGAILLGRDRPAAMWRSEFAHPVGEVRHYPARLEGHLDAPLSRGLWLVKWLLAIPHFFVLFFLWFALIFTTIISGFSILFTGRYPRPLFDFAVGVLRWSWRVAFYSYSALATDVYPPFTLVPGGYPADFDVDYPERLSRGLVLVKWWLLAIPHLVIVSVFTGAVWSWWNQNGTSVSWNTTKDFSQWDDAGTWASDVGQGAGFSLLGILVLIAALMVLFTGNYQRSLFDLVMGINRWIYRVSAYTLLLRDEYPPFRLDQGAQDPGSAGASTAMNPPAPYDAPGQPPQ